ncbi:hypothetical protein [Streptomyces sp. NPDC026092]|uniref:hypothetical protein n=1 Tax=Streptomyces sp. NPDC026092 TaxID=3154797 RepID=UPI0033DFC62C
MNASTPTATRWLPTKSDYEEYEAADLARDPQDFASDRNRKTDIAPDVWDR